MCLKYRRLQRRHELAIDIGATNTPAPDDISIINFNSGGASQVISDNVTGNLCNNSMATGETQQSIYILGHGSPPYMQTNCTGLTNRLVGPLAINGLTSGALTIRTQSVAGTSTWTAGTNSGTPAVTASSPLAISSATGNVTCPTCATTTSGGALSGTVPIAISAGGAISLLNAASSNVTAAIGTDTSMPTASGSFTSTGIVVGDSSGRSPETRICW